MNLYPLRFEPICQYRIWGGRRLSNLLRDPLPDGLVGEAWLLSDRDDHPTVVGDGPLQGATIQQLIEESPSDMLGKFAGRFDRFPLLLKFLDAQEVLSVQVHPSDEHKEYLPPGEAGKTEAWIVLETGPKALIYAGLKPGMTAERLHEDSANKTVADDLATFVPKKDDALFLRAGTAHTLRDVVAFEVQENSDVTFRLYDFDRVDSVSGKPRDLQVDQAIACIDFTKVNIGPVAPIVEGDRERIFDCEHFILWRIRSSLPFTIGAANEPRILVCVEGSGQVSGEFAHGKGDVMLLPAVLGPCTYQPNGAVTLFEIALPEHR